jgi:hypothetical protein
MVLGSQTRFFLEALTFLVLPTMRMLAPYRATRPDYNVMFSLI